MSAAQATRQLWACTTSGDHRPNVLDSCTRWWLADADRRRRSRRAPRAGRCWPAGRARWGRVASVGAVPGWRAVSTTTSWPARPRARANPSTWAASPPTACGGKSQAANSTRMARTLIDRLAALASGPSLDEAEARCAHGRRACCGGNGRSGSMRARPAGEDRGPSGTRRPAPVDTPGGIHALTQAVAVDRCRRRDGHGRDRHRQFRRGDHPRRLAPSRPARRPPAPRPPAPLRAPRRRPPRRRRPPSLQAPRLRPPRLRAPSRLPPLRHAVPPTS